MIAQCNVRWVDACAIDVRARTDANMWAIYRIAGNFSREKTVADAYYTGTDILWDSDDEICMYIYMYIACEENIENV